MSGGQREGAGVSRRVAIRFSSTFGGDLVDEQGRVCGDDSGATLVRRLLGLFPRPILVTSPSWLDPGLCWAGPDFDVVPLSEMHRQVNTCVVVNFDVLDSPEVYRRMKKSDAWHHPHVVNFVWWNVSEFSDRKQRTMIGQSAALFPTITNSSRTAEEIVKQVRAAAAPAMADRAWIETVTLGVDVEAKPLPRDPQEVPVVLYPAMFLFARKCPQRWVEIVGAVARRTPLIGEMRLADSHLTPDRTEGLAVLPWLRIGPLAPRAYLPGLLAATDVFLATSEDESYGLAYLEALYAGVVGIFPDRPWARAILPDGYPLLYRTSNEAETMLHAAVTRRDTLPGLLGDVSGWVGRNHDRRVFDDRLPAVLRAMAPAR